VALIFAGLSGLVASCGANREPAAAPSSAAEDSTASNSASSAGMENTPSTSDTSSQAPGADQPEPKFCEHDADCTLSLFAGCCTCCANVPRAFLKAKLANLQARCGKTMCPPCDNNCGPGPDMSAYLAACQNKACVVVPQ
jgi:hypothetical protein